MINTGPSRSFARGRRRGRSPRRFAPNNPTASSTPTASNQFIRDDSVPIQAQAPGLTSNPVTGTPTPTIPTTTMAQPTENNPINVAMPSTSAGPVNTNPTGMASMPGTMMNSTGTGSTASTAATPAPGAVNTNPSATPVNVSMPAAPAQTPATGPATGGITGNAALFRRNMKPFGGFGLG